MFKSIVWATDGGEHADEAYPLVKQLAQVGNAEVTIVHVVERIEGAGAVGPPRRVDEDEVARDLEGRAQDLSSAGVTASVEIRGDVGARPAHETADVARKKSADLIVAGTHGRSGLAGLLLGSETQRLLHIAPCPVLVVPSRERRPG
ncbi:MAG: universal stress protein [Actinomycetota bacterium]|nr:universal stress protein [Actinomycetota bacterium]